MISPERFQQVQDIFHAAVQLPPCERAAFLDLRCADDESLRRQIESLLSEDASGFLELHMTGKGPAPAPALSAGIRLGPYEIFGLIGAGGMGEVYRARDTLLNRDVALKVLPRIFAQDPDRVSRLTREAQLLASLNHPYIASIYALQESNLGLAVVMELVEGPTLAERIKRGPIPFERTLEIASQIAEALEAAHERGIIHRDLKPGNVKLTPEGAVKILDFGLGKALKLDGKGESPSSAPLTQTGLILGTLSYMSPEQARGEAVDRRADIWAFGVVLYEMLTGKRPFVGGTPADTLAAILTKEPDWNRIPGSAQPSLRLCMEKKPERRLRDIWDAFTLLEQPPRASPLPSRRSLWVASPLVIGLVIASWSAWRTTRPIEARLNSLVRLDVDLDRELPQAAERGADAILSPDGTRLLYVSQSRLFTRLLDQPAATELAGTEGAYNPFFSPDGQWIAFFTPGKLKKVSVRGGVPTTLCNTGLNSGGSWGEDGNIVAAIDVFGLSRIPSDGGAPTLVTELGPGEAIHRWPQVLPGGNAALFAVYRSGIGVEGARIEVLSLKDRSRKIVKKGGAWGRYLASGHLLYVEDNQVLVAPFDLNRMEMRGTPLPILPDVAHSALTGAVQLDCSRTGTIVYRTRRMAAGLMTVQWLDASGKSRPLLAKPGYYLNPRLSPDSERLVISSAGDIWVYERRRDTMTRLTFTGGNSNPLWSADSRCIVFRAPGGMFWIRADGDGKPQALTQSDKPQVPWSFTADGKRLAYVELNPVTGADLWTVAVESDGENLRAGKPQVLLQTRFNERAPAFSPGGRWLAYASDETGTLEVYVRDLRHKDRKIQISDGGGNHPVWSADGNDLFFTNGDIECQLMIARYTMQGDSLRPEKPRVWSRMRLPFTPPNRSYDVARGSQGVLALLPIDRQQSETEQRHIVFLQNFFDELRRREPYGAERQHRVIAEP